jgi:hypothetical protein
MTREIDLEALLIAVAASRLAAGEQSIILPIVFETI